MQRELPVVISPSRAEAASRCERRHVVADLLCYYPSADRSPHLLFGTAMHEAAAAWWKQRDEDAALEALRSAWKSSIERDSDLTIELAEMLVRYYTSDACIAGDHWAGCENDGWELVLCEERIDLPLGNARLTFKVDRLVRYTPSDPPLYVLVDTKTASRMGRYWRRRYPTSLQQKLYAAAVEEHLGITLDAHFIEGVLKSVPTEVRYLALDWPCEVRREALDLAQELAARDAELLALAGDDASEQELIEVALTQTSTNGDDCYAFNRKCELYELCHETPPEMRMALLTAEFEHVEPEWLE